MTTTNKTRWDRHLLTDSRMSFAVEDTSYYGDGIEHQN